jgi:hypothetical protein
MELRKKRHTLVLVLCFLGATAMGACSPEESEVAVDASDVQEAALASGDVGLCAYVCNEQGIPYEFCLRCCQNPTCCTTKKLRFCDGSDPLSSEESAESEGDPNLCAYVCIERGLPYGFCQSCCQDPACCAAKRLRFCGDAIPL